MVNLEVVHAADCRRRRVAQVLAEAEMDSRFSELIRQLVAKPAADEVTDAEMDLEVGASRRQRRGA